MLRVCGFLCSLVSGCYSFVLCISVSVVLDSHKSSDAENLNCGVLSPVPGGRMSKPQDFMLNIVWLFIEHVVEISVQFFGTDLSCTGPDISR